MIDYVVTMHGMDHIHKFKCHEIDGDDTKHDGDKKKSKQKSSESSKMVLLLILAFLVLLQVGAIVNAASGYGKSPTYDADIVLSVISPVMYWILRIFKKLGAPHVHHHKH